MADPFQSFNQLNSMSRMIFNQAEKALNDDEVDIALSYYLDIIKDQDEMFVDVCQSRAAQCHYRKSEYKKCIERCKSSIKEMDSKALIALALHKSEDYHSALIFLDKLSKYDDLSAYVKKELEHRLPDIKTLATQSTPKFPYYVKERVNHLKTLGNERYKKNDFVGAAKHYKGAIAELLEWHDFASSHHFYKENSSVNKDCNTLHGILLSNLINAEIKLDRNKQCLENCRQLLSLCPTWKKSYYWYGSCLIADWQFQLARDQLERCRECENASKEEVEERLDFVDFCERNENDLKNVKFYFRQDMFYTIRKSISSLSGNRFAKAITEMYQDTPSYWMMTIPALVDTKGVITDLSAPKYEVSEKDKNLINDMKRNEKYKIFIHLKVGKEKGIQEMSFSETQTLKSEQKLALKILKNEVDHIKTFNHFIKNYVS